MRTSDTVEAGSTAKLAPAPERGALTAREREARFRAVFESNLIAIAFWDNNRGFLTEANDAYLSLIGYTRAELESGKIRWRDLTPSEYQNLDDIALADARSRLVSKIYEKEYVRRDGARIPIVTGLATPADSSHEGLAFALDISERARIEARLLRSQKLESLSVLAGGVAHDFNNLLMGIIANVSLMMDDLPPDSPLQGLGENVLSATEQAANLTRQMLAFSGGGRRVIEPISLSVEVEAIASLIRMSLRKRVRLRFNLNPDLPRIDADPGQIQQLVMNLIQNADEAIDLAGSITVTTSVREVSEHDNRRSLHGDALLSGQLVVLEVTDTGSGMDEAIQARAFDPFFTTKFIGRGLGLAAVAGIVRGHGGGIGFASEPGKGTSFQVFFPVHLEAQAASG